MQSSILTIVKVKVKVLDNLTDGARSINPVCDIRFELVHQAIHINVSPLAVRCFLRSFLIYRLIYP